MEIRKNAWTCNLGNIDYICISNKPRRSRALAVAFIAQVCDKIGKTNVCEQATAENLCYVKSKMVKGVLVERDYTISFEGEYTSFCYPKCDLEGLVIFDEERCPR